MSNNIIEVRNISKQYRIGERMAYGSLRDEIIQTLTAPFKKLGAPKEEEDNTVWALKDVSFDVKEGEVVGIIGRNGAGKSTLLKILSRITEPTSGRITMKGRVASLLEVGTGFHPELTGRENILLNGALLGMTRSEIKSKFDEIVAFSEIEKFLDTPVKRYSSGMYVRLAFAVAAHLEPEILVVDEVLAVGDAGFQKKCLGKMGEVAKGGRTVLFVSHNMAAISAMCEKVVVLKAGQVSFNGEVGSGVEHYLSAGIDADKGFADLRNKRSNMWKQHKAFSKLLSIETIDGYDARQSLFKMGDCLKIKVKLEILDERKDIEVGIFIRDTSETLLGLLSSAAEGFKEIKKGVNYFQVELPEIKLMPGEYKLGLWVNSQREVDDACEDAIVIDVVSDNFTGNFVDYDRFKGYGSMVRSKWTAV